MIDHKNKTIHAWWSVNPQPGNFGDILTPFLFKHLYGYRAVYTPLHVKTPFMTCVGSIINKATDHTIVWGSGAMRLADKPNYKAKYLAVRGPITRDLIIDNGGSCPSIFGDPALLLPQIFQPKSNFKYDLGIIPHYVDYEMVRGWYRNNPEIKIINLLNSNVNAVITEMMECRSIVSSSLHGVIAAVAYGLPATWVEFSNKLSGDGTKFEDFFQSVKVTHSKTQMYIKPKIESFALLPYIKDAKIETSKLLNAFPIKVGSEP